MSDVPSSVVLPVAGVRLGTACAGIKKPDHRDLVVMALDEGSRCAAVFTRNRFCAAPVHVARAHLAAESPRWLLINTGNANAGTGEQGMLDAHACCQALAGQAGMGEQTVLPFSTGVIGEPLPVGRIVDGLPKALAALSPEGWQEAGWGILTTDTRPKLASRRVSLSGGEVTLTGMAKGSGMIRPNMATMLGFIATDADIDQPELQALLSTAVGQSFNRVTVDGDTSTNDACVLVATGKAGVAPADPVDRERLQAALTGLCVELARAIARDGEGATRLVNVEVGGASTEAEAEQVAFTVAESPLVKTALFAADPNWGRILAAVGRAGVEDLDVAGVTIDLDDYRIAEHGGRAAAYVEQEASRRIQGPEVTIRIGLGRGGAGATVWTCDFSYDYVRINAEYRT